MIINSLSPLRNAMIDSLQDSVFNVEDTRIIQRYFSEFFSAQSQYLESTSDINITGDYEVKGLVYKAAGKAVILFGNKTSFHSRCLINADGSVNFRAGDTDADELTTSSGLVPDNKLSTIYVKRAGTTGTITVNAETPVTGTVTALDAVINTVQRSNTLYGDSRAADLKLWTGNKETGSLIVDLAIGGDGSTNTVVNAANPSNNFTRVNMTTANVKTFENVSGDWLGIDFSRDADIVNEAWAYVDEKTYSIDGTNAKAAALIYTVGFLDEYTVYNVVITISDYVSGTFRLNNGSGNSNGITSDGEHVLIFNNEGFTNLNLQALANCELVMMLSSIRELMEVADT